MFQDFIHKAMSISKNHTILGLFLEIIGASILIYATSKKEKESWNLSYVPLIKNESRRLLVGFILLLVGFIFQIVGQLI